MGGAPARGSFTALVRRSWRVGRALTAAFRLPSRGRRGDRGGLAASTFEGIEPDELAG
jgi:hypothetical protein